MLNKKIQMTNKKIKRLLAKKQKMLLDLRQIGHELDNLIVEEYGFHYSETDDDQIIDNFDYVTNIGMTYETFHDRMMQYKEDFDNVPFKGFRSIP